MEQKIYLSGFEIRDYGCIRHFSAKLGQFAMIQGRNGAGKTTVLSAIRSVFEGGADPAMIRLKCPACDDTWPTSNGVHRCAKWTKDLVPIQCESAEIRLEFSSGHTAVKTIPLAPNKFSLVVTGPSGRAIKAGATFLATIAPDLSWDPMGWLELDQRDKAKFLLEHIAVKFPVAEVTEIYGRIPREYGDADGMVSLQMLNQLRQARFEERTNVGQQIDRIRGSVETLEKSLVPDSDSKTDWIAERDWLYKQHLEIRAKIDGAASRIKVLADEEKRSKKLEIEQKIADLRTELASHAAEVDGACAQALATATSELEAESAEIKERLGVAKTKAEHASRNRGILDMVAEQSAYLKGHEQSREQMTQTLERLDRLKADKLKQAPIHGFDLAFDEYKRPVIKINGLPLDQLNKQAQIQVAMQIVTLADGQLPLVLCECADFDTKRMREVIEGMRMSGMQLIAARWDDNDGPLTVSDDFL